jgi:hypothetical protein
MRFVKSPPELVTLFDEVTAHTGAERRQMFGYPCAFVNGNLCTGLFADAVFVRLGDEERAALLRDPGARSFEPMPGRPMKEYAVLPPALLSDHAAVVGWIDRAVAYAGTLTAKRPKRRPEKVGGRDAASAGSRARKDPLTRPKPAKRAPKRSK